MHEFVFEMTVRIVRKGIWPVKMCDTFPPESFPGTNERRKPRELGNHVLLEMTIRTAIVGSENHAIL